MIRPLKKNFWRNIPRWANNNILTFVVQVNTVKYVKFPL